MSARRIAVLGGGRSSEHEVSLRSAASVARGLQASGNDVVEITVQRDGAWVQDGAGEPLSLTPGAGLLDVDAVFPVLHGPYGEDGVVQGLLEALDVPYVGAGVMASAVCIDKVLFKDLMARVGLPQVDYRAVTEAEWDAYPDSTVAGLAQLGLPVFVKPARLGSSVGIVRVTEVTGLHEALRQSFAFDPLAIVEAAATGVEVECSILGNTDPFVSDPGEIILTGGESGWYDYEAKYKPGGMGLIVPARISDDASARVQELAAEAFVRAGCSGLARADFFVDGDDVLLNELNTMPGFTETSVYGALLEASGVPYVDVLDRLVTLGIERFEHERTHSY